MILNNARARYGALMLATAAVAGLAAAPAFAQKTPPHQSSMIATAFEDAYAYCMNVVEDPGVAMDTFGGLPGWALDEPYTIGTTYNSVSASYQAEGGEAYFSAQIETYPTIQKVLCTYDLYGNIGDLDIAAMVEPYELDGGIETSADGGTYGVYEFLGDDSLVLFRIEKYVDSLYISINWLGDAPAAGIAGPVKG